MSHWAPCGLGRPIEMTLAIHDCDLCSHPASVPSFDHLARASRGRSCHGFHLTPNPWSAADGCGGGAADAGYVTADDRSNRLLVVRGGRAELHPLAGDGPPQVPLPHDAR